MLESYIIWNGVSSEEFENLLIKKVPNLNRPKRKREVYQVPGRNGDVILTQDAYEDYDLEYQLFLYADEKGEELAQRCEEIADWLYTPVEYAPFVDSYDPEYTRYAYIPEEVEIKSKLAKVGTVKIPFRFRPERFLNSGLAPTAYEDSPVTLGNPTRHPAKPLIHLEADTSVVLTNATLQINDDVITITELADEMYIDCETMNAYKGNTNLNPFVRLSGESFPVLKQGANTVSWSNRIKKVTITPRWWTI